jgi:flagellar motor switch protein FliM
MSDILSNEQVAALIDAAREGELPTHAELPRRRRSVRKVDFSRPTKFTNEQERRLRRALETFCGTVSTRLGTELRLLCELEVINVAQLTWANAQAEVPRSSIAAEIEALQIGTQILLTAELPLVTFAIERLLGGQGNAQQQQPRRLTEVDWAVARGLFAALTEHLSMVWQEFAGTELGLVGIEPQADSAQIASVSEPTLALTIDLRVQRSSSTLMVLIPYRAIEPIAQRFTIHDGTAPGSDDPRLAADLKGALGKVEMTVRAEVAALDLPLERLLNLQPGDVLGLSASVADGVTVWADGVPVRLAKPGRAGNRRAIELTDGPR